MNFEVIRLLRTHTAVCGVLQKHLPLRSTGMSTAEHEQDPNLNTTPHS